MVLRVLQSLYVKLAFLHVLWLDEPTHTASCHNTIKEACVMKLHTCLEVKPEYVCVCVLGQSHQLFHGFLSD